MKALEDIKKVYFIGIGGIGMSALARYFYMRGCEVSGYDKTSSPLTQKLEKEGIQVHYTDLADAVPQEVELVVFTPAIPATHKELSFYRENGFPLMKRAEVLGLISRSAFTIAVSGSHGKTTVSAMIAHMLRHSGIDCTAFLGGISINYDTNYLAGKSNIVVVEADEFDRSFHQLSPDIAVITAVDTDHLDIYGTKENIDDAFVIFSQKLKANGHLVVNSEVSIIPRLDAAALQLYSTKTHQGLHVSHYSVKHGAYHVDIKNDVIGNEFHGHFILRLGGMHNVENALAAIAVGLQMGIAFDKIASAMESFKGIHRRFETIVNNGRVVYIDDYAHHPKEISSFLSALREMYPGKKITALFQPHLFSRTKDLAEGFAQSLSMVDELYLLDIYPARELPMEGVTSALILDKVQLPKKHITSKQEFLEIVADSDIEVLATIGAGDIDQLVQPLKELLSQR